MTKITRNLAILGVSTLLTACGVVERHASGMAEQMTSPKKCVSQSIRVAPSYTTTSSYRCVGDGCHDYGCGK